MELLSTHPIKKSDLGFNGNPMVKPNEWNYKCVGSFSLDSNNKWNKV